MNQKGIYARGMKRLLDFFTAVIGIAVLSPVLLTVAVLVRVRLGAPVIFKQQRPGKNEKIFNLYKFRTMSNERDQEGNLLPDAKRMTSFGHRLRALSLDELPELFNIVRGDMSFVGPRPLLVRYLPFYTEDEKKRHSVRPGLTGLAQINGRNSEQNWEKRFSYDLKYVENITFLKDCRIIFKTFGSVCSSEGVVDPGHFDDFDVYRKKQWSEYEKQGKE